MIATVDGVNYDYSRDHPFLMGSIHSWFYRELAGVKEQAPGYTVFEVKPWLDNDIEWVISSIEVPYGVIRVEWHKQHGGVLFKLDVPCGCKANAEICGKTFGFESGHYEIVV